MKKRWKHAALLALGLLLTCCSHAPADTIGDVWRMHGVQRVYLQEGGANVPFWLLDERDGACLLLREQAIADIPFAYGHSADSWYAGSALDEYLGGPYLQLLDSAVRARIRPANVVIYAHSSIGNSGRQTQTIVREVFALSWTELTGGSGVQEGEPVSALSDRALRTARTADGQACIWWLRTPDPWYTHTVLAVGEDGGICRLTTQDGFGVRTGGARPALYLAADAPARQTEDGWMLEP